MLFSITSSLDMQLSDRYIARRDTTSRWCTCRGKTRWRGTSCLCFLHLFVCLFFSRQRAARGACFSTITTRRRWLERSRVALISKSRQHTTCVFHVRRGNVDENVLGNFFFFVSSKRILTFPFKLCRRSCRRSCWLSSV